MRTLKNKVVSLILVIAMLICLCPQTLSASGETKGFNWSETYNMAVTEDALVAKGLPKGLTEETYVKWATCIGLWQGLDKGEVSNPVFLNGSLYIYGEKQLKKVNTETGAVEKTANLSNSTAYNYFFQAAGDILVIQEGLVLEAFDAELNSLWVTESMGSGNQGLCPLNYADGVIYGGTVGVGSDTGCYFAVSKETGKIIWKQEAELKKLGGKRSTGYYWAGCAVIGDYLVYGSEGGRVYSTNRHTGEVVDRYDVKEDFSTLIRSSVSYDGSYVYFTDITGILYQVQYDKRSGAFGSVRKQPIGETAGSSGFGSSCTATPVIYQDRLYVGDATCLAVFDTRDLSLIYRVNHKFSTLRDLRLVADTENNCVYVFTSYYSTPGSIVMMKDAPGQTSGELVDFRDLTTQWQQYNASMPIWGPDGTIYLTNDLGYLIAIGRADTWLSAMEGNGTFDKELNNGISNYEMVVAPNVTTARLTLTVNEGSTLKVNGKEISLENQVGTVNISLATAVADVEVSKGNETRNYRIHVREASKNAGIADVVVNQSNSLSGPKEVKNLKDNIYVCYGQSSTFMRLWFKLEDANAVWAGYALSSLDSRSKVDSETGLIQNTAKGAGNAAAYERLNLYWPAENADIVVKTVVTAEDGITTAERYYIITQTKEENYTGSQAESDALKLIDEDAKIESFVKELKDYYWQKDPGKNYYEEQQIELLQKLNAGITAIKAATTNEEQEKALIEAKKALDEVKTAKQIQNEKPKEDNVQDPGQGKEQKTVQSPKTGDTLGKQIVGCLILAVLALGVIAVFLRKRKVY